MLKVHCMSMYPDTQIQQLIAFCHICFLLSSYIFLITELFESYEYHVTIEY